MIQPGPEGTPYANGCFFFDFHLLDYPNSAPAGKFLTTGGGSVRFNPNLYNCGKICLSLLGTWSGPKWIPNKSTLLQILISIQGLILVGDPYFNEPGYESRRHVAKAASDSYNQNIRKQTLKWAIEDPLRRSLDMLEGRETTNTAVPGQKKPSTASVQCYSEFALVVVMHFAQKVDEIEVQLQEWTALDKSLGSLAQNARSLLKRVVEQKFTTSSFETNQDLKPAARDAGCANAKKAAKNAEPIEIL